MSAPGPPESPASSADKSQREHIIEAASEVFRAHGFSAARTKEIAERAGVAQPTLFRHFKTKKELFLAAVFEPLEQITRRLVDRDLVEAADGRARSDMYLAGLEGHLATAIDVTPLLGVGLFSDPELGRAFYVERFWPLIQRWVGTTDATLRGWPHRDVDPLTLVMTVWGMCYGVAVDAILSGAPVDVAEEAKQIRATLTSGMT
jgi:AcrR family transcriptional regulator